MATQAPATNWPGGSYDPETHILYVHSQSPGRDSSVSCRRPQGAAPDVRYHQGTVLTGARRTGGSGSATTQTRRAATSTASTVQGLPLVKPPYGRINAIDLDTGDILWQVAARRDAGRREEPSRAQGAEHPAHRPPRHRRHARHEDAASSPASPASARRRPAQRGSMLRAYDKRTGAEVGAVYMPAPQTGSPMTYMLNGKQYLVVAISGGNYSGSWWLCAPELGRWAGAGRAGR